MKSSIKQDKTKFNNNKNNDNNNNNKKNLKSAAKKRNNNSKENDFANEEYNILDLIANNSIENENSDKKYGFEDLFSEFEKPLQIYAYLGLRQKYQPLFLTRNLSYMNVCNKKKNSICLKNIDLICNELYNKKINNNNHNNNNNNNNNNKTNNNYKSIIITFLLLQLTSNENPQFNIKKKAKLDNHSNSNRRSICNKAFIEIYTFDDNYELVLNGKCEITNIIENNNNNNNNNNNSSNKSNKNIKPCSIEIDIENNFFNHSFLYFRLIFVKDIEIEFTNTFKLKLDFFKNEKSTQYSLSMYEMINDDENKTLDLVYQHKSAKKLFNDLPLIKFQIDLNASNTLNHIDYSSVKSNKYNSRMNNGKLTPLPILRDKKNKNHKINGNKNSNHNSSLNKSLLTHINNDFELYYQFIGKNNIKVLTKFDRNNNKNELFICPFCYLNCKYIESLLKHLSCNHFRFQIESIPATITSTSNRVQLNITINELYNGSYLGNCYDAHSSNGFSISRYKPIRRIPVTFIYVCKKTNLDYSNDANDIFALNEIKAMSSINGLEKLFYHTRTCSIINANEINDNMLDSDDELDPEWLKEQTELFIQEFADVNQGEKEIMRLWNLHIIHHNFISDSQVYNACETFIEKFGSYLLENNLVNNFYLHLANLNDFGLLESNNISKLCDLLFKKTNNEYKK